MSSDLLGNFVTSVTLGALISAMASLAATVFYDRLYLWLYKDYYDLVVENTDLRTNQLEVINKQTEDATRALSQAVADKDMPEVLKTLDEIERIIHIYKDVRKNARNVNLQ